MRRGKACLMPLLVRWSDGANGIILGSIFYGSNSGGDRGQRTQLKPGTVGAAHSVSCTCHDLHHRVLYILSTRLHLLFSWCCWLLRSWCPTVHRDTTVYADVRL